MAKLIRQDTGATLELPFDLYPVDEFGWSSVVSNQAYALDGTLIVEQATRKAGKPITLQASDDMGAIPRQILETLTAWANTQGLKLWYQREGKTNVSVSFDNSKPPIEAKPLKGFNSPSPTDLFNVVLYLIEVA